MCVGVLRDNLHCDLCIINKKNCHGKCIGRVVENGKRKMKNHLKKRQTHIYDA